MSWSKKDIINQAYEFIGLAAYVFDLESEQYESARRKMDAMVATWETKGVRISYPMTNSDNTDLDNPTDIPDKAFEALYMNLALRLAPGLGKSIGADLKSDAIRAYKNLINSTTHYTVEPSRAGLPLGAGHKGKQRTKFIQPDVSDPIEVGSDGPLTK